MRRDDSADVVKVVVDVPARAIDAPFDYLVPEGMTGASTGAPVLVPLGPRQVVGYVVGAACESEFALKPVSAVLGPPLFQERAVGLARWIANEYLCPLSEALRLFLPPGGTPKVRGGVLVPPAVDAKTRLWVEATQAAGKASLRSNALVMRSVLDALAEGPAPLAELVAELGPSASSAVRGLEREGLVKVGERRVYRDPLARERSAPYRADLSQGQREALEAVREAPPGGAVLLDGVTGSGKTEVYLQAIEGVVASGGSAIVLIPEISLTPQTVGRFRSRLGASVAVLHSRLSAGERYDQWELARQGTARVVVGARSALFAPVEDLRLIVIDEEHEPSYKQASAPRYHAREVARKLAEASGAILVLGSATPSMESLRACAKGETSRVSLPERVGGGRPSEVTIVDMGAEFAEGHRGMFSRELTGRLQEAQEAGSKAVVFLNRRGFASFLLCRECGLVPGCPSCSTSLTYHEEGAFLACHHCGHRETTPAKCPRCGSPYLRLFGAGTQRVEAELASVVPDMPVVRMDADTTSGKGGHERALAAFEALPSGILLGTQMVAKGLDYPEVTLVGVVNADTTLHFPDFRASERTYQLLEQVAGRAGRGTEPGHVVIQTYWPDHPAIRAVAVRDPSSLYKQEEETRSDLRYPPFGRMAEVLVYGRDLAGVRGLCEQAAARLKEAAPAVVDVLGPSPAVLWRLKGNHRWHVTLKAPEGFPLPGLLRNALAALIAPEGLTISVDVDPVDVA